MSIPKSSGKASLEVYSILKGLDGKIWIGSDSGISVYKDDHFEYITNAKGAPINSVRIISEDKEGNIWFSSEGRGLFKYNQENFIHLDKKSGLGSDFVAAIYFDRDNIPWIGTYGGGLSWIKDNKIYNITVKNGLFDNIIYTILESQDKLWMSCNNGIFSVSKDQLLDFEKGKIGSVNCTQFNESSGMVNRECNGGNSPVGWKDMEGRLWFPSLKGLVMINPEKLNTTEDFPPVFIEKINVDGKPSDLNREIVHIPAGYKRIEFQYTGLSFINSENIQFKVRLSGLYGYCPESQLYQCISWHLHF